MEKDNDLREQIRKAEELAHRLGQPIITATQDKHESCFQKYSESPMYHMYVIVHIEYDENTGRYASYSFTMYNQSIDKVYDIMRNDLHCTQNLNDPTYWKSTVKDNLYYKVFPNSVVNSENQLANILVLPIDNGWSSRLCCLQVFQIDLTELKVKLILNPNGYKSLGDLPLKIGDDDMVLVVQSFGTGEHDNVIKMYMSSKARNYASDVEVRLYRKLKELGLTRFDVFCSMSKGFKDRIKPMLKPIAGFDKYLYCKL